jgi:hypothetical protein
VQEHSSNRKSCGDHWLKIISINTGHSSFRNGIPEYRQDVFVERK